MRASQVALFANTAAFAGAGGAPATVYHTVVDTFTANGTWTAPSGIKDDIVKVQCWGGGAGSTTNVGGGGGGAYAEKPDRAVVASTGYAVVVSAGGSVNADGGDSSFDAAGGDPVIAKGGLSGTNGGTGGTAAASTGTTKFSGGNGALGIGNQAGGGGAGESAAGSGSAGGEPNGGGSLAAASPGMILSAGAGSSGTAQQNGARGEVRITYQIEAPAGFPYIAARSYGRSSAGGTSHPVTMPAGIVAGDGLMVIWGCDGDNDGGSDHTATGWTQTAIGTGGTATTPTGALLTKTAAGSDTCTITTTDSEEGAYVVLLVRDGGTPTVTVATGSSTNGDPPSHDAGSSQKYLWISAIATDGGSNGIRVAGITAPPTNYGDFVVASSKVSGGTVTAVAGRFLETQVENPGVFTHSTEEWVAMTIAIPPAV